MNKILALDIETTGLNPWKDDITLVGLYDGVNYRAVRASATLRALLAGEYADYSLVCHNAAFDIKFLEVQGWWRQAASPESPPTWGHLTDARTIYDTQIMASLLRGKVPERYLQDYAQARTALNKTMPAKAKHRKAGPLSLKVLAPYFLGVPRFWETPGNYDNEEYNKKDCVYTYDLYHCFADVLKRNDDDWQFYLKMLGWAEMLRSMETKGIGLSLIGIGKVEAEYLTLRANYQMQLDTQWAHVRTALIASKIDAIARKKYKRPNSPQAIKARERAVEAARNAQINYRSPKQMTWLLRDQLGLQITNSALQESTGKAVLKRLAAEGREDVKTFLDWREADKVLTAFLPKYKELQENGNIHPNFNITGTRTGRLSSSSPNLQQVPSKLYRVFQPRADHLFIKYDLSSIEAALIALYSGDPTLYKILQAGESIHDHNAKALFSLPCTIAEVAACFARERRCVKNIGFACFYGAGWQRIQQVHHAAGFIITDAEAKWKLAQLREYYAKAFEFHKEITQAFEEGQGLLNLLGRPIYLQPHENPYMQGFNTLVQSSASDLCVAACYRYWLNGGSPLLLIHDAILAEELRVEAEARAAQLKHYMTDWKLESVNGPIQLRVEGGISEKWEK